MRAYDTFGESQRFSNMWPRRGDEGGKISQKQGQEAFVLSILQVMGYQVRLLFPLAMEWRMN